MSMVDQAEVYKSQLVEYLSVTLKKYIPIKLQDDGTDTWLVACGHLRYAYVVVTTRPIGLAKEMQEEYDGIQQALEENLPIHGQRIEFYIGTGSSESFANGKRVVVSEHMAPDPELTDEFPGIENVLHSVPERKREAAIRKAKEHLHKDYEQRVRGNGRGSQKKRGFREKFQERCVTYSVMILCVLVYIITLILNRYTDDSVSAMILTGAYYKAFVLGLGEWWRLLTAGFAHTSLLDVLLELYVLAVLGYIDEKMFGHWRYAVILIGSSIASYLFLMCTYGNTVFCGMSGGIYGAFGASVVYHSARGMLKRKAYSRYLIRIAIINVILLLIPGMIWQVSLGGFIAGVLIGLVLLPDSKYQYLRPHAAVALVIYLLVMIYMAYTGELDAAYQGTDLNVIELAERIGWSNAAKHMMKIVRYYRAKGM